MGKKKKTCPQCGQEPKTIVLQDRTNKLGPGAQMRTQITLVICGCNTNPLSKILEKKSRKTKNRKRECSGCNRIREIRSSRGGRDLCSTCHGKEYEAPDHHKCEFCKKTGPLARRDIQMCKSCYNIYYQQHGHPPPPP